MIIIGLGNPSEKYEKTRHNIGRDCVIYFSEKNQGHSLVKDNYLNALVGKVTIAGKEHVCVLPETYMNDSGLTFKELIKRGEETENFIVVHDDLDIPFGQIKISFDKNSGGHNGLSSIFDHIKSNAYIRVRIGISPKNSEGLLEKIKNHDEVTKFVLSRFKEEEQKEVGDIYKRTTEILETIIIDGLEVAMNKFNHVK